MNTVIFSTGTAQKGNLLTIHRLVSGRIKRLKRRLKRSPEERKAALQSEIQRLQDDLILVAADLDGIEGLDIPEPLDTDSGTLPVTAQLAVVKPGPDTIEKIKHGLLAGHESVNPEAYKLMETDRNGTGGTRPNGRLTIEASRARVKEVVAAAFDKIAQRRREAAPGEHDTILVFLLYTSFGGFASGAHAVVEEIWEGEASARQFPVQIVPVLLLPHGFAPDDAANTNGVTYGVLKELSANSTKRRNRREFKKGQNRKVIVPQTYRQTLVLSDTNMAGGRPRTLPRRNFNGMVAQLVLDLATTSLGERFVAKLTDFNAGGEKLNPYGETRHGVTLGVSAIVLDRERLFLYMAAELRRLFAEQAVQVADEPEVMRDARGCLESQHVVQGDGRDDLSTHLVQMRLANDLVSPERTAALFRVNSENLAGLELFRHAAEAMEAAIQQNGDLAGALAARSRSVIESMLAMVDSANRDMAGDPQRGLGLAWQRTDLLAAIVANMVNLCGADTATLQEQVNAAHERVQHYQTAYMPELERKGFFYRFLYRGRIAGEAQSYSTSLLVHHQAQCRLTAHLAAVETLSALHQPLKDRADRLQSCIKTVNDEKALATTERTGIANHSADMMCPLGLPLLSKPEQFEDLNERLLPETEQAAALAAVYARLRESEDLLATLSDPAQLRAALDEASEDMLRGRVELLHVVDELRRRYDTVESLGPVLRERDFEATERLMLNDSVDSEQQPVLVRLLAMDAVSAGDLLTRLNEFSQARGHQYTLVNTGDRDRIVLMQIRAGFALSDWVRTTEVYHDYSQAAKEARIERHHTTAGVRALPEIGRLRTAEDNRVIVVRAWLLGRLYRNGAGEWLLRPVDPAFGAEHLGTKMELLTRPDGFAIAVDLASHFECEYFASGPAAFEQKLARLKNPPTDATEDETEIAKLFDSDVEERFRSEMAWWSDNTVPGAMDWYRAKAREAAGVMAS